MTGRDKIKAVNVYLKIFPPEIIVSTEDVCIARRIFTRGVLTQIKSEVSRIAKVPARLGRGENPYLLSDRGKHQNVCKRISESIDLISQFPDDIGPWKSFFDNLNALCGISLSKEKPKSTLTGLEICLPESQRMRFEVKDLILNSLKRVADELQDYWDSKSPILKFPVPSIGSSSIHVPKAA